jgi:hypothetical protein
LISAICVFSITFVTGGGFGLGLGLGLELRLKLGLRDEDEDEVEEIDNFDRDWIGVMLLGLSTIGEVRTCGVGVVGVRKGQAVWWARRLVDVHIYDEESKSKQELFARECTYHELSFICIQTSLFEALCTTLEHEFFQAFRVFPSSRGEVRVGFVGVFDK